MRSAMTPPTREKRKIGQAAEKGVQPEQEGGIGELEDEPALREDLHPGADTGGTGAYPHQAEIAILKCFEDPADHD